VDEANFKKGDLVYVDVSDIYVDRGGIERNFIGEILELTPYGGVTLKINSRNTIRSLSLERCSHATEKQRIEYFKNILKYGYDT